MLDAEAAAAVRVQAAARGRLSRTKIQPTSTSTLVVQKVTLDLTDGCSASDLEESSSTPSSTTASTVAMEEQESVRQSRPPPGPEDVCNLILDTKGLLEKEVGGLGLGWSWEVRAWHLRWVFASAEALCWQKVPRGTTFGEPRPRTKGPVCKIPFRDVRWIGPSQLSSREFVLLGERRNHVFAAPNEATCVALVRNLRLLHARHLRSLGR